MNSEVFVLPPELTQQYPGETYAWKTQGDANIPQAEDVSLKNYSSYSPAPYFLLWH